jgi:DNA-binding NarL/FixJ family response regulator
VSVSVANGTPSTVSRPLRLERASRTEARQLASGSIRAVVGTDDPLYAAGIAHALEQAGGEVVASADNADDLERKIRAYHPDVAVVDIDAGPSLIDDDWLQAARNVRSIAPFMPVLILSQVPDEQYALAVLGSQPRGFGYLLKARIGDLEDFTASVHRVAQGGSAIDPAVIARLAGRRRTHDPVDDLTKRERQVLALIAEGRSNRFIASELVVTVAAVERHITSIFAKLGVWSDPADHRRVLAVLRYLGR